MTRLGFLSRFYLSFMTSPSVRAFTWAFGLSAIKFFGVSFFRRGSARVPNFASSDYCPDFFVSNYFFLPEKTDFLRIPDNKKTCPRIFRICWNRQRNLPTVFSRQPYRGAGGKTAYACRAIPFQKRASEVLPCSKPISFNRSVKNRSLTACSLFSSHQSE